MCVCMCVCVCVVVEGDGGECSRLKNREIYPRVPLARGSEDSNVLEEGGREERDLPTQEVPGNSPLSVPKSTKMNVDHAHKHAQKWHVSNTSRPIFPIAAMLLHTIFDRRHDCTICASFINRANLTRRTIRMMRMTRGARVMRETPLGGELACTICKYICVCVCVYMCVCVCVWEVVTLHSECAMRRQRLGP